MYKSLIVVDDFYADPHEVRAQALKCDYPPVTGMRTFPGRNAAQRFVPQGLDRMISIVVGEAVKSCQRPQSFHGCFRLTLAGEESRYQVHVDPSFLHWVGVVYLNLPEHCRGGTAFYRHKALGSDRTPLTREELQACGVSEIADLLARDGNDLQKWEHLMTVPMRFNRLILYRPWLWHSAEAGFGDGPETGRLIQVVSFEKAEAEAPAPA